MTYHPSHRPGSAPVHQSFSWTLPRHENDEGYGYCNACGEELWDGAECCEDGEWVPADGPEWRAENDVPASDNGGRGQ